MSKGLINDIKHQSKDSWRGKTFPWQTRTSSTDKTCDMNMMNLHRLTHKVQAGVDQRPVKGIVVTYTKDYNRLESKIIIQRITVNDFI
ncbi:Hypothetical predicted protein [Mytilus galloprovincialis]|uniref:Uncharacterized protein n=1 Tax=Mytilus galloprovincialis TaxID=29158 RepID=A0A8B6BLB0_MYTGA|nr:Hypothetical predicted protein [Mytilus galloprovincialis]